MKRDGGRKRHRLAVAATVLTFVGIGLASPFIISGTSTDLSLQSAAVIAATRDSFTLTSPITLSGFSNFQLASGTISMAPSGPGDVMTGAAALAMLASGKAKLKIENASMSLDLGRAAGSDSDADEVPSIGYAPVLAALVEMSFAELAVHDSELTIRRADGSVETLTAVTATITRQRTGKVKASGRFDYRGRKIESTIHMDLKGSGDGMPPNAVPLDLVVKSELLEAKAAGMLSVVDTPQFTADDAKISLTSIRDVAAWLGADWGSQRGLGKFEVQGALEWTPRGIAFPVARATIDGNVASGTLALKLANQRAAIDGTLDFETLDVSPYLEEPAQSKSPAAFDLTYILPRHLTGTAQFPILQDIDADLRISAGKVVAKGMPFGKGAASLSLKSGVMLADLAELEVGKGGRCAGQLSVNTVNGGGAYHLKSKMTGIEVAMLGGALWSHSPVSGIGNVVIDVTASGHDKSALIESAVGKVAVDLPASGHIGIDLKTLAATARAETLQGWGGAARGQTQIDNLTANLVVDSGRLWADRVVAKSGDTILTAHGSLHMSGGLADIQLWIAHPQNKSAPASAAPSVTGRSDADGGGTAAAAMPAGHAAGAGLLIRGLVHAPSIRFVPAHERAEHWQGKGAVTPAAASPAPGPVAPRPVAPSPAVEATAPGPG